MPTPKKKTVVRKRRKLPKKDGAMGRRRKTLDIDVNDPAIPILDREGGMPFVIKCLQEGGTRTDAATVLGCSRELIAVTMQRDDWFGDEVRKAEHKAKLLMVRNIRRSSKNDWRAAAWYLSKRYWREFSDQRDMFSVPEVCEMFDKICRTLINCAKSKPDQKRMHDELEKILFELRASKKKSSKSTSNDEQ